MKSQRKKSTFINQILNLFGLILSILHHARNQCSRDWKKWNGCYQLKKPLSYNVTNNATTINNHIGSHLLDIPINCWETNYELPTADNNVPVSVTSRVKLRWKTTHENRQSVTFEALPVRGTTYQSKNNFQWTISGTEKDLLAYVLY